MNRVDNGSSVLEWASLARTKLAAGPSSVDEVAIGLGLLHSLRKHRSVSRGVKNNEGLAVAGRERWARFKDAVLGSRSLRGVCGDDVSLDVMGLDDVDMYQLKVINAAS